MPFISEINHWISEYPENGPERIILEFLYSNGVGRSNAQPWKAIDDELKRHGYKWRLQKFQQGLLKKSREGDLYIGSNDHGAFKGYYLIKERKDAELMAEWYRKRIETEQDRLNNLRNLIEQEWS